MSLQTERILLESKINALKRDREMKAIEADMHIVTIRQESSPLLNLTTIDIDRLEVAIAALKACKSQTQDIDREITRLEKALGE